MWVLRMMHYYICSHFRIIYISNLVSIIDKFIINQIMEGLKRNGVENENILYINFFKDSYLPVLNGSKMHIFYFQ